MTKRCRARAATAGLALLAAPLLAACDDGAGLAGLFAPPADPAPAAEGAGGESADPPPPAVPRGAVEVEAPTASPAPGLVPQPAIAGESGWSGVLSAAASDMRVTAKTAREWDILWQLVGREPPGPLPDGAMAAAVLLDSRPTAGFGVEIVEVRRGPDQVTVRWRETSPAPDAMVGQMITAPWAVRLVGASPLPVVYAPAD